MNEIEIKKNEVATQDYKAIAAEYLTSMGLNLKEQQKKQFIDICCVYGLNPIKKEVYGIQYGEKFNIIVGYETYLKRAERSGLLNGYETEFCGSGDDLSAKVTIYRKDWERPFVHEVFLSEYKRNTEIWKEKPKTMLRKVALAQGFRNAFPEDLGGIPYTKEEMGEEEIINVTPTPEQLAQQVENNNLFNEIKQLLDTQIYGQKVFSKEDVDEVNNYCTANGLEKTLEFVKGKLKEKTK